MDYEGNYPGQVKVTRCLKWKNITASERRVFNFKYYRDALDESKAKKVKDYIRDELIKLLIARKERGTCESDDADDISSEENISDESSDSESGSDSGSNGDSMT